MKSLVIYDSQYGNTRLLAEAIASELEAVGTVAIEWEFIHWGFI